MGKARVAYSKELVARALMFPAGTIIKGCWFEPQDQESEVEGMSGQVRFLLEHPSLPEDPPHQPKDAYIQVQQDPISGAIKSEFHIS